MVLDALNELASGFEGCEKKLEIDFLIREGEGEGEGKGKGKSDLRLISRCLLVSILSQAKCSILSEQTNSTFISFILSESSLFIYKAKIVLKTCGTTLLLMCVRPLLAAAEELGAEPDFLQFSRSNFLFPQNQHYPHRAFNEEVDFLNDELKLQGEAYILGSLNGARWHLYILDFKRVEAKEYQQQTLEVLMFGLEPNVMKTFYKCDREEAKEAGCEMEMEKKEMIQVGEEEIIQKGSRNGEEATRKSGIDRLMPGARIDANLFTPCGYSCNAALPVLSSASENRDTNGEMSSFMGKQGVSEQAYFTIHVTPEPQCSFVSFETNAVLSNYDELIEKVVNTFQPRSFCVSLFVDADSSVSDSRAGFKTWSCPGFITKGMTHHSFQAGYNATVAQFEADGATNTTSNSLETITNEFISPAWILNGLNGLPSSFATVATLSAVELHALAVEVAKQEGFVLSPRSLHQCVHESTLTMDSLVLFDVSMLLKRFKEWSSQHGSIEPVFTFDQCMPAPIIQLLAALGAHVASRSNETLQGVLKAGLPPSRTLMDIPLKTNAQIVFAHAQGLELITVGSTDDMRRVVAVHNRARCLLSLSLSSNQYHNQTTEIGFSLDELDEALTMASQLNLFVSGVKVNNWPASEQEACSALISIKKCFYHALQVGHKWSILYLGDAITLHSSLSAPKLNEMFHEDVRILANCHSFFDRNVAEIAVRVKQVMNDNVLVIDDACFNALCCGAEKSTSVTAVHSNSSNSTRKCIVRGVAPAHRKLNPFESMIVSVPTTFQANEWIRATLSIEQLEQAFTQPLDAPICHYALHPLT